MAKTNSIGKPINGEIIDADDYNQNLENAGAEGGLIPYDATSHNRDSSGDEDIGSVDYPFGDIFINMLKKIKSVDLSGSPVVDQEFTLAEIMQFIKKTDTPASYSGNSGKFARVNNSEDGLEFASPTNFQLFTSSGTFTAPAGVTEVYVTMIGGGGGGGGGSAGYGGGGGGAAGMSVINRPFTVTPGNNYTVTVGAAGSGGASNNDGTDGGDSSFDSLTAKGGAGGLGPSQTGGSGVQANASGITGGSMGINGGSGADGTGVESGGGGGSPFGAGGNGSTSGAGTSATGYGAGGGGADQNNAGGNGSPGLVIVMY